jgi:hypothetical protein
VEIFLSLGIVGQQVNHCGQAGVEDGVEHIFSPISGGL